MSSEVDWAKIEAEFNNISFDFLGLWFLGDDDFEQERLHRLTYGLLKSPFPAINHGAIYIHERRESQLRSMAEAIAIEFDARISDTLRSAYPPIKRHVKATIENAIKKKTVTHEFIEAWAHIHVLHCWLHQIILSNETNELAEAALKGVETGIQLQKYWFAQCVVANALPLTKDTREDVEDKIFALCKDIAGGRIRPWEPYPSKWFEALLEQPKDKKQKPEFLGTSFRKLGLGTIEKMARHPVLTREILPPVDFDMFMRVSQPPGGGGS